MHKLHVVNKVNSPEKYMDGEGEPSPEVCTKFYAPSGEGFQDYLINGDVHLFPSDNSPTVFEAHISLAVNLNFPMLQHSSSSRKHPRRRRRSPLFSSWMQTRKSLGSQSTSKETLLLGGNGESKSKRKNLR
jgi:hypothetical protein